MSSGDKLVPLKTVLKICGVSRATLWRVSRSNVEDFARATKKGGRLYWRESEIEAVKSAIEHFDGRTEFDHKRRSAKRRAEAHHRSLAAMKKSKSRTRRMPATTKKDGQGDLFSV